MLADFRAFVTKSNAMALAIGVISGAAVGNVVSALVADLVMPVIGLVLPSGSWREAKLATRAGMGACQGKTCGAACQFLFGWAPPAARIPIVPASAAALSQIE